MKWNKVEDYLSAEEVLAVNDEGDFLIGTCGILDGDYICEDDNGYLLGIIKWVSLDELRDSINEGEKITFDEWFRQVCQVSNYKNPYKTFQEACDAMPKDDKDQEKVEEWITNLLQLLPKPK